MVRHRHGKPHWSWAVLLGSLLGARVAAPGGEEPPVAKTEARPVDQEIAQRLAEPNRLNKAVVRLFEQGRFRDATEIARQVVAIHKDVVGDQHPLYASSLSNLASLMREQGDLRNARSLNEQALEIRKRTLGERHPLYANSLNNLAELFEAEGDYARAEPLLGQAVEICKQTFGERHPTYALSLNNLASLLQAEGDSARARLLYTKVLAVMRGAHAERHPSYATMLNNLASLLAMEGDHAGAQPLLEHAHVLARQTMGEHHPGYANCLNNLAMLLKEEGNFAGAKPMLEQALAVRRETLGEHHPNYAVSLNGLATLLEAERDFDGARARLEQAVVIRKEALGEHNAEYAESLNNIALLLEDQGKFAEAKPLLERALAVRKEALGERHPTYATGLGNLTILLYFQGDSVAATPLLRQSLEITAENLELAAAGQSERRQLAMARSLRENLDAYLLLAPLTHVSVEETYQLVLTWKGSVLARQRRNRELRRVARRDGDPEVARLVAALEETSLALANTALAVPESRDQETWRRGVAGLSAEQEQLEEALAARSAEFRATRVEAGTSPARLRARLPGDAALVDFLEFVHYFPWAAASRAWKAERHLAAFVVRPGHPITRLDLGPVEPIARAVASWRASIGVDPLLQPGAIDPSDPATALRASIWQPLEPLLEGVATVLISPDGILARLPLAALPGKVARRYLLEERSIAYVPVPQLLPELLGRDDAKGKDAGEGLLLVGDVDFGALPGSTSERGVSRSAANIGRAGTFGRLEGTRAEVATVERLFRRRFPDAAVLTLDGGRATERTVREQAGRHRWLHLATHGFFAPPGLRSALQMTGDVPRQSAAAIDPFGGQGIVGFHPGAPVRPGPGRRQPSRRARRGRRNPDGSRGGRTGTRWRHARRVVGLRNWPGRLRRGRGTPGLAARVPGGRGTDRGGQPVEDPRRVDADLDGTLLREPLGQTEINAGGPAPGGRGRAVNEPAQRQPWIA
jgi:tetratricopeptide (TPR) repeat protein